jgi:lipase chaperone LimK
MTMRPADAKKTAGTLAMFGLAGLTAAATVWYLNAPARAPDAGAPRAATKTPAAPLAQGVQAVRMPAERLLPVSLAGSMPPRLPLDERGHLRKARGVRDFFDYFLTARNQMPPAALDALVHKEIAAQLDGTKAQREALDVWQRYMAYLKALDSLAQLSAPPSSDTTNERGLDAMRSSLDERASLASRSLGVDWSEAFFGPDWRHARYTIERWRIQRDPTLTDAQKAARLQALQASLPPEQRAALERDERAQARVMAVAKLGQQGMTLDRLRAKATLEFGPQAAERIVDIQQDDDAWRAKYADYSAQRARIDETAPSPAEREAQVALLRQRMFKDPAQALRAAALDQGSRR